MHACNIDGETDFVIRALDLTSHPFLLSRTVDCQASRFGSIVVLQSHPGHLEEVQLFSSSRMITGFIGRIRVQ